MATYLKVLNQKFCLGDDRTVYQTNEMDAFTYKTKYIIMGKIACEKKQSLPYF